MRDQEQDVLLWPLYLSTNLYTCPLTPRILKKKRIISVIEKDESLQSLVLLYSCLCAFITRLWKQKLILGFLDPATGLQREKRSGCICRLRGKHGGGCCLQQESMSGYAERGFSASSHRLVFICPDPTCFLDFWEEFL